MEEVPQTGSGKVKKHVLRKVGEEIVLAAGKRSVEMRKGKGRGTTKAVIGEIAEEEQTL